MPYRNAIYWFAAVLLLDITGFWPTYFSKLSEAEAPHHAHAIAGLSWMILLITQAWLIRNRKNQAHRMLGRLSLLLAPMVVITAVWVNHHLIADKPPPHPDGLLGIFWFGYFSAGVFAICYVLAIANRRRVQYHARYMAATALAFLIPGLSRTIFFYLTPLTGFEPSFTQLSLIPLAIAAGLLFLDFRGGKPLRPNAVVTALWVLNLAGFMLLPRLGLWQDYVAGLVVGP